MTATNWQKGLTARQVLRVTKAVSADNNGDCRHLSRDGYKAALAAKAAELYPAP